MPQRKSNMVCPDWAKRELYGEPYVTRQEVCEYLGISISTLMKLRKSGLPRHQHFNIDETAEKRSAHVSGRRSKEIPYFGSE